MAFDRKSSMYSDHGTFGSAEELEAYGVWVKSEPQDLASSLADVAGFGGEPYETDYDAGFDGMGIAEADFSDIDSDAPQFGIGLEDYKVASYDEPVGEERGDGTSSQILEKIAGELSSIRSELSTLKKEFADIRLENSASGRGETAQDGPDAGFFAGAGDEKIALSGDEMDSILTSADFSEEDEFTFDSLRDEDAAALKKLSEQNEASAVSASGDTPEESPAGEEEEIIDIDLENLGIDLDSEIEKITMEAQAESPEEAVLALDDVPQLSEDFSVFDPLEDIDEMRNLRLEGADPFTPAPEDTSYLEENHFPAVEDDSGFEALGPGESPPDLLNLDDASFDLGNFSDDSMELDVGLGDELSAESQFDSLDLSNAVIDEPDFSSDIAESPLDEPIIDEISIDAKDFETSIDMGAQDDSLVQIIPEGFEQEVEEAATSLDDELEVFVEEDLSIGEGDGGIADQPVAASKAANIPAELKSELKNVLSYMDHLLESLPEEKIEEFAQSEQFDAYKKIFKELGLT